ncbi:MAG: ATP-binding cassette domain-containing protein [Chloroflexi bacterium]|nr:ATP-binding cassette domain-containing protein [Chloroflexota bacterium]
MSAGSSAAAATFWRQLPRNRLALAGAGMLLFALGLAVFAPLLAPEDPRRALLATTYSIYAAPNAQHWLGTDDAGRDVLSNLIFGARVSLTVGFFASFISIAIGGSIGMAAGFAGGVTDRALMRFTDVVLVIPDLPLAIVLVALTKPSLFNIILVIGLVGWTGTARLVRAQTLAVKERKFVHRARAVGASDLRLITRHIFPLVLPLLVVNTVLVISLAILEESALSFLGLSDPTTVSWGQMLNYAFSRGATSSGAWWALLAPGAGIVWVVLGCTLLGYGLEQALNPRVKSHHLMRSATPQTSAMQSASPAPADALLEVRGLSVDFVAQQQPAVHAVQDVSFALRPGEIMGLVGESGCGKTTLSLSLLRLLPAAGRITGGQVLYHGRNLLALPEAQLAAVRWKEIAIVFQGAMNALNPLLPVGRQIAEAVERHEPAATAAAVAQRVGALLEQVGIPAARGRQFAHQYSGGMRQRAMIAMALACNPKVIICDEPTTALDVIIQAQILELLNALRRQLGLAVIFVTHDLGVVAEICDTVLVMYGGVVAEYASVDTVFNQPQHPYTRALLAAFPDFSRRHNALVSIPGQPPRLHALPPGCRFAPRCSSAQALCHTQQPHLLRVGAEHYASCHLLQPMLPAGSPLPQPA